MVARGCPKTPTPKVLKAAPTPKVRKAVASAAGAAAAKKRQAKVLQGGAPGAKERQAKVLQGEVAFLPTAGQVVAVGAKDQQGPTSPKAGQSMSPERRKGLRPRTCPRCNWKVRGGWAKSLAA